MSIFIICQCVQGALATSDSASYLGISSKQTAKLAQIVLTKGKASDKKKRKSKTSKELEQGNIM